MEKKLDLEIKEKNKKLKKCINKLRSIKLEPTGKNNVEAIKHITSSLPILTELSKTLKKMVEEKKKQLKENKNS